MESMFVGGGQSSHLPVFRQSSAAGRLGGKPDCLGLQEAHLQGKKSGRQSPCCGSLIWARTRLRPLKCRVRKRHRSPSCAISEGNQRKPGHVALFLDGFETEDGKNNKPMSGRPLCSTLETKDGSRSVENTSIHISSGGSLRRRRIS